MSNTFDPTKPRKKIHWMHGRKSMKTVRAFRDAAEIGAQVVYQGNVYHTECHPGLNTDGDACVFLDGVETPVPLYMLELVEEPGHA